KTICFADNSLLESLRLISATVVDGHKGGHERGCDLAVAEDPNLKTLGLARLSLRPGGFLYSEWRGLLRRGKWEVRKRLESAGFEEVTFYWPHPDPSVANPEAWIPLRGRRVLRHYFVDNRGKSPTALRRAARQLIRIVSASAPRFRLAQPICAVSRRPSAALTRTTNDGLDQLVIGRWAGWQLGHPPKSLSWLLLTGGLRSNSKVIALAFA